MASAHAPLMVVGPAGAGASARNCEARRRPPARVRGSCPCGLLPLPHLEAPLSSTRHVGRSGGWVGPPPQTPEVPFARIRVTGSWGLLPSGLPSESPGPEAGRHMWSGASENWQDGCIGIAQSGALAAVAAELHQKRALPTLLHLAQVGPMPDGIATGSQANRADVPGPRKHIRCPLASRFFSIPRARFRIRPSVRRWRRFARGCLPVSWVRRSCRQDV